LWAQPAAPQALVKSFRVLSDRSDIVHDLASKRQSPQRPVAEGFGEEDVESRQP
jgi:hypothetical protein